MKLLVIFPCYNEQEVLENSIYPFFTYFEKLIAGQEISKESRICFVDDGSKDDTWKKIEGFEQEYILGIKFSNNFGHQKALFGGLETFKNQFDSYVTLDVDFQDDYNVLGEMIVAQKAGVDIVYGVRNDRSSDSFMKQKTAETFYRLMGLLGVKTIYNHADFRMINNKALLLLLNFTESHLFLRAIFPEIGLSHSTVYYKRNERVVGKSKYPLKKMVAFAWDGITSFSTTPLKLILYVGLFSMLLSIILIIWATIVLLLGNTITGWFSIITLIMFFGGIQTFAIGIIGEYIGKIFLQVKQRPRYLIDKIIKNKSD